MFAHEGAGHHIVVSASGRKVPTTKPSNPLADRGQYSSADSLPLHERAGTAATPQQKTAAKNVSQPPPLSKGIKALRHPAPR